MPDVLTTPASAPQCSAASVVMVPQVQVPYSALGVPCGSSGAPMTLQQLNQSGVMPVPAVPVAAASMQQTTCLPQPATVLTSFAPAVPMPTYSGGPIWQPSAATSAPMVTATSAPAVTADGCTFYGRPTPTADGNATLICQCLKVVGYACLLAIDTCSSWWQAW